MVKVLKKKIKKGFLQHLEQPRQRRFLRTVFFRGHVMSCNSLKTQRPKSTLIKGICHLLLT